MLMVDFFSGDDGKTRREKSEETVILELARFSDKDMARLRKRGDALPHVIYANPALQAAKKRGVSLAETGRPRRLL